MGSTRPKVFICYQRKHSVKAEEIYNRLLAAGVQPWLDAEHLVEGDLWANSIRREISLSDAFVVLIGPDFEQGGFRQTELQWALEEAKSRPAGFPFIIPFVVEPCVLPSWCQAIHVGDPSKPTELERLIFAIGNHFRLVLEPQHGATAVLCLNASSSVGVPLEVQALAVQAYASAHRLAVVHTLFTEGDGLEVIADRIQSRPADAILIYRVDCLAAETLNNLAKWGEFFSTRKVALRCATEQVDFVGGYRGYGPTITCLVNQTTREARRDRIRRLQRLFTSYVAGSDGRGHRCPNHGCNRPLAVHDQFASGGGVDYYAPLRSCGECGWHGIGAEFWTTDY
jgi:hypothetical protein